jgi:hypothetical protein
LKKSLALHPVEFYFISHRILEEAGQIAGYTKHDIPFETSMVGDIPKLVQCVSKMCDLRNESALSKSITGSDDYPPDELRRRVVLAIIDNHKKDKSSVQMWAEFVDAAEQINKSVEILWDVIKTDFAAGHARR